MNTTAQNTTKSSANQELTLYQLSDKDAAQDSTQTDSKSYKPEEILKVSVLLLEGLIAETCSPDLMYLSLVNAKQRGLKHGLNEEMLIDILNMFSGHMEQVRQGNPLSGMF